MVFLAEAGGGHNLSLLNDLALVLMCAGGVALLFARLRLPILFGYLAVGILLGPHVLPESPLANPDAIGSLAELGVIFLLFYLGIEFDLRRLQEVFAPSAAALLLQTITMLTLGWIAGEWFGWGTVERLFFGSLLSISSSMVTVRVLRSQGRLKMPHARLAVGVLILEDILAVLLLVILTGVAVTQQFDWEAVGLVTYLMGVFVVAVYLAGRMMAGAVLKWLERFGSEELLTLFAVGLVMGVSWLAAQAEFSVALGAFLAGAILSETRLAPRIEVLTRPLYEVFSAVFFVAMGILIDPWMLWANAGWILLLSFLLIGGKITSVSLGLLLSGQPARSAFRGAVAKAQIGEFSFVIASLGLALKVTDARLTSLAFGVALVSILVTPLLSGPSLEVYKWLRRWVPRPLVASAQLYRAKAEDVVAIMGRSVFLQTVKPPFARMVVLALLMSGALFLAQELQVLTDHSLALINHQELALQIYWGVVVVALTPLLALLLRSVGEVAGAAATVSSSFLVDDAGEERTLRIVVIAVVQTAVIILAGLGLWAVTTGVFREDWLAPVLITAALVIALFFGQVPRKWTDMLQRMWQRQAAPTMDGGVADVQPFAKLISGDAWPLDVREFVVTGDSVASGQRIQDIDLRSKTGALVVAVGRGADTVFDPHPATPLFEGDRIVIAGEPEQVREARELLALPRSRPKDDQGGFTVTQMVLRPNSPVDGETLAGADLRRRYRVSVLGVQFGDKRTIAPPADHMLRGNELLVIMGSRQAVDAFVRNHAVNEAAKATVTPEVAAAPKSS